VLADRPPVCSSGADRLAHVWELTSPDWPEGPAQKRIHTAFLRTGKSYAADVYETVSRSLSDYAARWSNLYRETCEATQLRHEQSPEVLDLRMSCLNQRLNGLRALGQVFETATGEVVENAVSASGALASLDRCSNIPLLRAVVPPPDDPVIRAKVNEVRQGLADLKARFDAGRWRDTLKEAPQLVSRARGLKYDPLIAETLELSGSIYEKANGPMSGAMFSEAYWLADASSHDEVRAEAATQLVYVTGYRNRNFERAHQWAERASAVIRRLGGHDLLRAWLLNNVGCAYFVEGRSDAAVASMKEGLAVKARLLGPEHQDVALSEGNLGYVLGQLGRPQEGLTHTKRAVAIEEKRIGSNHPILAGDLANEGELLNGLGRFEEARAAFAQAKAIFERELGRDAAPVAYALTGIGVSYLGQSDPAEAIPILERAAGLGAANDAYDPMIRADSLFALARALWASGTGQARVRARKLAVEAREVFGHTTMATKAETVNRWLAEHLAS